jgi:hypothetical protein
MGNLKKIRYNETMDSLNIFRDRNKSSGEQ